MVAAGGVSVYNRGNGGTDMADREEKKNRRRARRAVWGKAVKMELKEHKSSFLVYTVLRILVILTMVRQFFMGNYENVFLCLLTLALLLLAPVAPWAAAAIGVCVIWGACSTSFNAGAQAEVIRVTNEEQSAVAMSIFSGLFNVGIGGGSIIGGAVCDTLGVGAIGLVGGIVAVAGALWCALVLGRLLSTHNGAN